jgi:hypothetical protein
VEKPLSPASGEIETANVTNSDWTEVSSITWASGYGSS